jgi:hypothetical protein
VGGADLDAGRIAAVVTSHDPKVAFGLRELAGLHVFHPGSKHSDRDLMFLFARHRAGMAANTSVLVDYESITHKSTTHCTEDAGKG